MSNIPIATMRLDNGLLMVHSFDASTAMVAVDVLYNTGSRDEKRSLTGMAHLFEHLMFGGSVNVPDYDAAVERAGGKNNAWTSADFTNFYITVPAQNAETAFYLESDRMLGLSFSDKALEVQRGVVIEEFKQQCLDRPYGRLMHHLRRMSYSPEHPYSWPTIGLKPEHIAKVTQTDVKDWFFSHYAPNNAILSISGNITFERACELTRKWFGDIPSRDIAARRLPDEGFPSTTVSETVRETAPMPLLTMAFPMAAYGKEGYAAADAVTDLLAAGKASRFYRNIVHGRGKEIIDAADAYIIGSEHPGLLIMSARLRDDSEQTIRNARDMILEETSRLTKPENFAGREYERMLNNFETEFRFSNLGYLPRATNLALAQYHGSDLNATVAERRKLHPEEVSQEARRLLESPRIELAYLQA